MPSQISHSAIGRIVLIIGLVVGSCIPLNAQLNTDRITSIGRNALFFEDYVLSIQYFNQVIHLKPYLADPYLYRAIAKVQLEDYQGARRDCDDAIRCNPFMPVAYYTRSYIYMYLNQLEEAEKDMQEALVYAPDNKTYKLLLHEIKAGLCLQQKDTTSALGHYRCFLKADSTNSFAWSAIGTIHLMQDSTDLAFKELSQAIRLGSKWSGDYINRGIIAYQQHNYQQAIADYDKAVELSPKDAGCYYNRAMLRHELGDYNRALNDYNQAIALQEDRYEMYYQRSITLIQLRQYEKAIEDLNLMIEHYPYFLPSYFLLAQAYATIGNTRQATRMRQTAYQLEQQKDIIQRQRKPNTDTQMDTTSVRARDIRKEFSLHLAQSQEEISEEDKKYDSSTRGSIQKVFVDIINEPNIQLTYYAQPLLSRQTNYTHPAIEYLNRRLSSGKLCCTSHEMGLTPEMVNIHFTTISQLANPTTAIDYFHRAIELAMVQDYRSAIDDCTLAAQLAKGDTLLETTIYFCRANWRWRMLEVLRSTGEVKKELNADFDIMLRDYDQVLRLDPNFAFAYYNQANIFCQQRAFETAIKAYTSAIAIDRDFAEAYFNRGLTYIYINQLDKGLEDLSKAGEMGIYQAYNLILRFKK